MKRIYLLAFLFIAFTANSFAQSCDLMITTTWHFRQGGNNLLVNGGPGAYPGGSTALDTFFYTIKNVSQSANDSTKLSDTIRIRTWFNSLVCPPSIIKKDSSKRFYYATNFTPTASAVSGVTTQNLCDSMWAVKQGGAILTDPAIANNKFCYNLSINIWQTDVTETAVNNEMSLYPNPASYVVNMKYHFAGTDATVTVRDLIGKIVYTRELGKNLSGEQTFPLDMTNYANGVYMIELMAGTNKVIGKVTVQK